MGRGKDKTDASSKQEAKIVLAQVILAQAAEVFRKADFSQKNQR